MSAGAVDDLVSVVYVSTAATSFEASQLGDLLAQSRTANAAKGLTGLLLYRGGRFIQVLEGPRPTVLDLVETLRRDPRHVDMRVLLNEGIDRRSYSEWTMGYEPIDAPGTPAPEGFRDTFDDLESDDDSVTARAVRELTVWFRARSSARG